MAKKKKTSRNFAVNNRSWPKGRPSRRRGGRWGTLAALLCILLIAIFSGELNNDSSQESGVQEKQIESDSIQRAQTNVTLEDVPDYSGEPYIELSGNVPDFDLADVPEDGYESYSELDSLGRCGAAYAKVGPETMPTEERGRIGMIKPSGWHTVKYPGVVEGNYLYNRCHLIGYQLTAENANEKNLITGTRYMNTTGMLGFEDEVADYVHETGNHVLYRVTPIFTGDNLVASGVQMEAMSVEDEGEGVSYNVFVYNVQPGIEIDYATGESRLTE